ncbi:Na+/H+ antiporter subunit A [Ornithinimicrobium sediminis]|uniref:Na+/H+ antiporter subunit A n=1 Tax=Ornithinimicrobium sediminis TaxID=2904603 RepID=UPI001E3D83DA|nr:Na+/H+ antiporter subunit A [Ornithinimicrobium sediminis]
MLAFVTAHAVAALVAPWLVRAVGPRAFLGLAAVPAVTAVWALTRTGAAGGAEPPTQVVGWVDQLGIDLAFRLDTLAWLMTLIVCGIGAMVLLYCSRYFADGDRAERGDIGRFAAYLTAFAGAMLGLVTTDDLLTLYVFWELTTVLSYLLIGYHSESKASRGAAKQSLIVTIFGGLAMLVGIVLIGQQHGTYRTSEVLAQPETGTPVVVGVVLLLVGAVTKSALVPFHFWLPAAMAAPTPVSAYLHAAAMVKAGIYLVARFAPAYADLPVWQVTVLVLGAATMLLGAWRALRQCDLKLLLAYGTVSQLGFLVVLVGTGTREAALAGTALLVAHALFKSTLFLTVGTIDHAAGTRDLRDLDGLGRRLPWLAGGAGAAAVSMAGLPPLLGFAGKEAAYEAFLHPEVWLSLEGATLGVLVLGSVFTLAYSARFLWGAFGPAQRTPRGAGGDWHEPAPVLVAVPVALGVSGLVLGPLAPLLEEVLLPYAAQWPEGAYPVSLAVWHGVNPALLLSVLTWLAGAALFLAREPVATFQARVPRVVDAGRGYQRIVHGVDRGALEVTGAFQRGSLPKLLGIILSVLVALLGAQLLRGVTWPSEVRWADTTGQVGVAVLVVIAAVAAVRARRRFRAVFLLGVTGYGTAMLFLLHGAPDLALTQVLVETVSLVVFVLVLRRLSGKFPDDPSVLNRRMRAVLGVAVGLVVAGAALTASAVRFRPPAAEGLLETAKSYGGGDNIVNVILVDVRAWDTMGELSVVLAAATGVASLVFLRQDAVVRVRRQLQDSWRTRTHLGPSGDGSRMWLAAGPQLEPRRRSTIFEVVTRLVFHTVVLWSLYLLFSGHNNPGGGFAAGLVCGLALALRYLAGRGYELRLAAPVMPGLLLGAGLFIAAGAALLPMLFGYQPLRTFIVDVEVPVLGNVHLVTSLLFDVGVYLVVIGLVLDILRSLGSALDDQIAAEEVR